MRNGVASADWVVGIFPGFFELFKLGDIGTAGHNGFQDDTPKDYSFDQYLKSAHGAALHPQNHESLARFILTGEKVAADPRLLVKQQNSLVVLLAKQCWAVWSIIALITALLGIFLTGLLSRATGISLIAAWPVYILLLLLLLYTL